MIGDNEKDNMEGQSIDPSDDTLMKDSGDPPAVEPAVAAPNIVDPVMELPEIPGGAPADMPAPLLVEVPARKSGAGWKMFASAVALVAMGAGVGSATTWALASKFQRNVPIGYSAAAAVPGKAVAQSVQEGGDSVIPGIYRRVSPSVVAISVYTQKGSTRGQATGTGFVVDSRGYILTNNHVVEGGKSITVKFVDGTTMDATLVGADKYQDLAVLKVNAGGRNMVAASLGDSDAVQVGELAVAIGTPFEQEFTVTAGIVSAINREVQEENNPFTIPGAIQTDAAINPGNSGGPLFNGRGEVIGINTLIETGNSGVAGNIGIGFAIPINAAKAILPSLISGEKVQYPWIGIGLNDLTSQIAQSIGTDAKEGAVVGQVYPDSPAEQAGIKGAAFDRRGNLVQADVVTAIDGQPVKNADDLVKMIRSRKVGDQLTLTVVRGKEQLSVTVKLASRPDNLGQEE
jgi:S1-C subfamily serine protease